MLERATGLPKGSPAHVATRFGLQGQRALPRGAEGIRSVDSAVSALFETTGHLGEVPRVVRAKPGVGEQIDPIIGDTRMRTSGNGPKPLLVLLRKALPEIVGVCARRRRPQQTFTRIAQTRRYSGSEGA